MWYKYPYGTVKVKVVDNNTITFSLFLSYKGIAPGLYEGGYVGDHKYNDAFSKIKISNNFVNSLLLFIFV